MATGLVCICSEKRYSAYFCMYVSFPRTTAGLVTISKRAALPIYCESHSQYQNVRQQLVTGKRIWARYPMSVSLCQLQPAKSLLVSVKCYWEILCMEVSIPHSTTGRVPSSKRQSLMGNLHKLSVTWSACARSPVWTYHSQSDNRPSSYQLQRIAAQNSQTQHAYNVTVSRERSWDHI
jgi:hypothetical protein